jgi:Zn-dependent M16 (insulinase) family peptidase
MFILRGVVFNEEKNTMNIEHKLMWLIKNEKMVTRFKGYKGNDRVYKTRL